MIASLRGIIQAINEQSLILDVNGVGYLVHVPTTLALPCYALGDTLLLYTHLHLREDNVSLYGFSSADELWLFETLISVSGLGPKLSLSMLSTLKVEQITTAIVTASVDLLTMVPGIGKKTANRIILGRNNVLTFATGGGAANAAKEVVIANNTGGNFCLLF